jgi:hypothetical protein
MDTRVDMASKGQTPWNKGKRGVQVYTKERNKKISESSKGKIITPDQRMKISESLKGRYCGVNHPFYGKCHSEDTKRKLKESHKLEKAPGWKGGISFLPYCTKFNDEFKERVRKFFNHTCQLCGHVWQSGEKRLAVHHVNYDKMTCCNTSKPLFVPVCTLGCHAKTNHNREYWEEVFTNLILLEHGGECF